MAFRPGMSGNPGGRTKEQRDREKTLADAIRGLAGANCETYVQRLHDIALEGEPKDSIAAIKELLNRSHGKATDHVQLSGSVIDPNLAALVAAAGMTPHERRAAIASAAADVELDDQAELGDDES